MNDHLAIDEIEEGCLISQEAVPENEVDIQSGAAGFDTGKGEKLRNTQAGVAWVLLSFSLFPVSNPAAPLCTSVACDS